MDLCECTDKCRSLIHGDIICAALTKRDITDTELCSYFNQVCYCCESVRDSLGRTALQIAASVGRVNVVKWLLRRKQVNINARDTESGYTALHRSVFYGKINSAVILLQAGANNNVQDHESLTCLDHAMKNNPFDEVPYLDGEVYVWGANTNYIFGIQQARHSPDLWDTFHKEHPREAIRQICLGKFHCLMVSRDGHAYSCGHGQGGRLGLGSEQTVLSPKMIKFADTQGQAPFYCIRASLARDHSVFLMESDEIVYVWTCGLNTHHVLGINPPPQKLTSPKRLPKFKYQIDGVCAARYHSVAWGPKAVYTWGLHGGQLGHDQNTQKYISSPKLVTCLSKMKTVIQDVVVSGGATVVATSAGDIFVLHEYQCRKISSRQKLLNLSVVGGRLNTSLDTALRAEKNSELKILVLTEQGRVLLWQESDPHLSRCILSLNRDITVVQIAMNMCEILFISNEGEAFQGTIKNRKKKSGESCSASARNPFHKFLEKDECHFVKVTKLPRVYRAVAISTDSKGGNFAIIQTNPKNTIYNLPQVTMGTLTDDIRNLLRDSDEEDFIHDVVFKVGTKSFPAHRYIIAGCSEKLKKMMTNNDNTLIEINNTYPDIFEEMLLWMYTGKCSLSVAGVCPERFLNLFVHNDENKRVTSEADLKQKSCDESDESKNYNGTEISAFEHYNKNKSNMNKTSTVLNKPNKDPIRLLQDLAKQFEVTTLEKRLSKLTIKDGKIVFTKTFEDFLFECKRRFNYRGRADFYNVNIVCKGGQILQADRCILVARVDFFQKLYSNRWNMEPPSSEISLPYTETVLELFLEFLYTDELTSPHTLDLETLCNLLILSDQYFIMRLKEICEVSLCNLLSFKTAVQLFTIAGVYNTEKLKVFTMKFICLNLAAFLESRSLENLDDDLLNCLTDFYCKFNSQLQNRIITPYSTATADEEIKSISNMYPISLDIDDEFLVQSRCTPKPQKRRPRVHKVGSSEVANSSGDDLSPEKPETQTMRNPIIEEYGRVDDAPLKSVPIRIKAITVAHAKIKAEHETSSFVQLPALSAESRSDTLGTSYEAFPVLTSPGTSSGSHNKSPNMCEKIDWHRIQKISQKQRKRLSTEENVKETTNARSPGTPKNPWKIIELLSPVGSPDAQLNMNTIITEEKKMKENFSKMVTKPLHYTQMEDKAIEELQKFYNSFDAIEEVITTERVAMGSVSAPVWVQKSK